MKFKQRSMNKYLVILGIILFFSLGFITGRITSDNGRYSYKLENNQLAIFDSKTGKFYIKEGREKESKYFSVDVINAKVIKYKSDRKN